MALWQADWYPWEMAPIVSLVWMNWDDDDDGKMHHVWLSYVVYPFGDSEP
jgi:hypothetical protein